MTGGTVALPPWAQVTSERRGHIQRVADLVNQWAVAMAVASGERGRWLRAVSLHDALKDAPLAEQRALAPDAWSVPELLHGPAAAAKAEADGETDPGVLSAVRYHSVGYPSWDAVGRILFLADYLEPGRRFRRADRATLARQVPNDLEGVLREVLRMRMTHLRERGMTPLPEMLALWRTLE